MKAENLTYVSSERAAKRVLGGITSFVEGKLKLKVNSQKSTADRPWKRKLLGFSFTSEKEARVRLAPKTIERFKEKIRKLTSRSWGISMKDRLTKVNEYLGGWIGYFQLVETPSTLQKLDEWIRRRLRMCRLKQWKKPKTKRRNLVALGIPADWARKVSGSRKGYWRLSNTPQVNKALGPHLLARPRAAELGETVLRTTLFLVNRRVRNRTHGGVRGRG